MPIVLANLAACLFMTGLIWFVQVVHYPLFDRADSATFREFAAAHQSRTSLVVFPVMLIEALTAVGMLIWQPSGAKPAELWLAMVLLVAIWLSTAFLQVPEHGRLSAGYLADAHRRLVATNWIRTVAWTLRSAILLRILSRVGG
jgi:hypothetical protein